MGVVVPRAPPLVKTFRMYDNIGQRFPFISTSLLLSIIYTNLYQLFLLPFVSFHCKLISIFNQKFLNTLNIKRIVKSCTKFYIEVLLPTYFVVKFVVQRSSSTVEQ